ncbi:MAG: phage holin [Candidatus Fimenecus sp.]
MTEKKTVKTETIVRTIVLILAVINQLLQASGKNPLPFAEDELYKGLTICATVGATLWAWWKNNSFTQEALKADETLKELKEEAENE